LDGIGPEMPWQLRDDDGAGMDPPRMLALVQVNSYCAAPQSPWQLSVPPVTPPSAGLVATTSAVRHVGRDVYARLEVLAQEASAQREKYEGPPTSKGC
jgi:hypothetical protein